MYHTHWSQQRRVPEPATRAAKPALAVWILRKAERSPGVPAEALAVAEMGKENVEEEDNVLPVAN